MKMQGGNPQADSTKGFFNLFLIIFLGVGAILAGAIAFVYQVQTASHIGRLKSDESVAVKNERRVIGNIFKDVIGDLEFLSQQHALIAFLIHDREEFLTVMDQEYLVLSRAKKDYDQIRFLDAKGMEIVRVDYNEGHPVVVSRAKLQNKAERYYFANTFALDRGRVFVSPFDLNIEHGKVERPLKPVIRFGMPVFDQKGKKRGIVLLNYLGARLLDSLKQAGEAMYGQPLLINREGYWLQGPLPGDAWGFMLPKRKDKNLSNRFPVSAPHILKQAQGQITNREGMFSFTTLYPLRDNRRSGTDASDAFAGAKGRKSAAPYYWKLISYITRDDLDAYSQRLLFNLALLGAVLFLLDAVASWLIAGSVIRKRIHRAELFSMAHFDALTGLPNRTLYFDRLAQTYEASKRHGRTFAILYIDLDDFKIVNDTMGHSAGDMLLKQVSNRMLDVVRKSDTVGRMGGDEFMMILTDLSQPDDAELVAQKLLGTLTRPVDLDGQEATVGASIGLALFPDDADDMDQLIKMADEAMYACKAAGKNLYKTASSLKTHG